MYRVLIVEDEILVSIGLKNMLDWQKLNMQVVGEAPNGQAGYTMYQERKPDLILTDIKMPVMDGLELIRRVRQNDQATRFVILTCYQEFDLVQQALRLGVSDYILKLKMSVEEMEAVLSRVGIELKSQPRLNHGNQQTITRLALNQHFLQILHNPQASLATLCQADPALAPLASTACLAVLCIAIVLPQPQPTATAPHTDSAHLLVWDLLEQEAQKVGLHLVIRRDEGNYLILLDLSSSHQPELVLQGFCQNTSSSLKTYLSAEAQIGLVTAAATEMSLPRLIRQAQTALNDLFFTTATYQYPYTSTQTASQIQQCSADLADSLSHLDIDLELKIYVQGQLSQHLNQVVSPQEYRDALIYMLYWTAAHRNLQPDQLPSQMSTSIREIRQAPRYCQARQSWLQALSCLSTNLPASLPYSREIRHLLTYIDRHLDSKVTLKELAASAGMSPNYLCTLFKKETGINLFDYITKSRIERAKQMLLDSNQKTYEIAEQVGFSDESYFIRVFKRVAGITPNEYRKKADV